MRVDWTPEQIEWLEAMGFDILRLQGRQSESRPDEPVAPRPGARAIPGGLARAAGPVDLTAVIDRHGIPRDPAARRAFWRVLRPLRKAARG